MVKKSLRDCREPGQCRDAPMMRQAEFVVDMN